VRLNWLRFAVASRRERMNGKTGMKELEPRQTQTTRLVNRLYLTDNKMARSLGI